MMKADAALTDASHPASASDRRRSAAEPPASSAWVDSSTRQLTQRAQIDHLFQGGQRRGRSVSPVVQSMTDPPSNRSVAQREKIRLSPTEEIDSKNYTEQQLRVLQWHYQQQGAAGATVARALRDVIVDSDHDETQSKAVTKDYQKIEGVVPRTSDDGGVLTTSERRGVRDLTRRLIQAFPPADYLYVSLGSSPALLTGLLQLTIDNAIVADLPISNVGVPEIRDLTDTGWNNLCAYARTALKGRETQRAKVVVVDFIEEGRGVALAKMLLERLLPDKKPVRIFSLSSVSQDDVKANPYLKLADITQIDAPNVDESAVFASIMSCRFKNIQLLRKYDAHDLTKIATGEIRAPKQDAAKTFWLFQTLIHTIDWLQAQHLPLGGGSSRDNVDDFVGKAHRALEEIVPIPQLQQLAPRLREPEEMKADDIDAADQSEDSAEEDTVARLAALVEKWLGANASPNVAAATQLIREITDATGITIDNFSSHADFHARFKALHPGLSARVVVRIEHSEQMTRQQGAANAAGVELMLEG